MQAVQPAPMQSTPTGSELSHTGQLIARALGLSPPTASDPGYWKSTDGFVAINGGLLKSGYRNLDRELKALVTFEGCDAKQAIEQRVRAEVKPVRSRDPMEAKRAFYQKLRIAREERLRCVGRIVKALDAVGVHIPTDTITVHRVAYSFFAKLDLRALRRLCQLNARGQKGLRRIRIDTLFVQ